MRYIFSLDDDNTLLVPPEQFTGDDARTFRAMISDYLGCNPSVLATRIYLDARPITRIDADGLSAREKIYRMQWPHERRSGNYGSGRQHAGFSI